MVLWITEKSQTIYIKEIHFRENKFRVDFFSKTQILLYLEQIFLVWIYYTFQEIIRIKIQNFYDFFENSFQQKNRMK